MGLKLSIGREDEVQLPPREAEALGAAAGEDLRVVSARGAFALLTPARAPDAYVAGSLSCLSVAEVVQFVFTSLKSGVLLLSFGSEVERAAARGADVERLRRKSIYFRDGQVVFASSSDPSDRLGAVLWRNGLVGEADLERCGRLVRSGWPLGQVLVDEGVLTSGQLYSGLTFQVRDVVLSAFIEPEGQFAFLEGPHDERNAVKLPDRTRDLLLEGMRRMQEVERIAAGGLPPRAVLHAAKAPGPGLDEQAARLAGALDGRRTLREAMEVSGLGLYDGMRSAEVLLAAGIVTAAPAEVPAAAEEEVFSVTASAPEAPAPRASGPFETYRRIFKYVFDALAQKHPGARDRLNSYFERVPEKRRALFEGVRMDGEGELDVAQVLLNVSSSGAYQGAAARARALEALEDFLAFALFEVKNVFAQGDAEAILREVGRMQVGKA